MTQNIEIEQNESARASQVVLLAPPGPALGRRDALFQSVALTLARHGHTLALWLTGGLAVDADMEDWLLTLQLAIEQAGGISLAQGDRPEEAKPDIGPESDLQWAIEAFGRIDAAIVFDEPAGERLAQALAAQTEAARPKRVIVPADMKIIFPPLRGTKITPHPMPSAPNPEALALATAGIVTQVEA